MNNPAHIFLQNRQMGSNKALSKSTETVDSKNQGTWTATQQKKYIVFLQKYKKQLQNKQKRKNYKIFKEMALFVGSRDGIQCRSHHMKLLRTHAKIRKIINHFKEYLNFSPQCELFQETEKSSEAAVSPESPLNKKQGQQLINKQQVVSPAFISGSSEVMQVVHFNNLGVQQVDSNFINISQDLNQAYFQNNWYPFVSLPWAYFANSFF